MHLHHIILQILSIIIVVVVVRIESLPTAGQDQNEEVIELIRVQETLNLIKCQGIKQTSDLAPESQVVGVHFDVAHLNTFLDSSIEKLLSSSQQNKTKQSQDFDLGGSTQQPANTSEVTTIFGAVESTTSSSTTREPPTIINEQQITTTTQTVPVASLTIRKGESVLCGEANPNGKSNKKLVLDRIVGGRKTEPGEFPFQVRLNIKSRRGSGICGGVILNERYIMTAAHCMTACVSQYLTTATIETTGVHATIGDHSIKSNDGELEIDIDKIIPHEKYDACNFYANDHDIALIRTSSPIEYRFTSDGYGSINRPCMPANNDFAYKDGELVIVSGWGITRENSGSLSNILRYVQVPVVNVTKCQETYGGRVTSYHVCAGYQSGGKDSCQGDSGGPLVRVIDNKYELVGIVSFGYGCGQPGAPGVYTRVASYIDWIKSSIQY